MVWMQETLITPMLLLVLFVFVLSLPCTSFGRPFQHIYSSPSVLPSQSEYLKAFIFEDVHLSSIRASVVPERAPHRWQARPSPVPLAASSSPTSQGPVAGQSNKNLPKNHHHHHRGAKTRAVSPSPSAVAGCDKKCSEPLTSNPFISPCSCVLPMKIRLIFDASLLAIFPVVNELEIEVADATYLVQSQVVIIGASADHQNQERTAVDINLVPLGERFDNTTATLIYERFWQKKVPLNKTLFGTYDVAFITYTGLPALPPTGVSSGHEIPFRAYIATKNSKMDARTIWIISSSALVVLVAFAGAVFIFFKYRKGSIPSNAVGPVSTLSIHKRSGIKSVLCSATSTASSSPISGMPTSILFVKTFSLAELVKATDNFSSKRVLGEGGFGCVYLGLMEDQTEVAVKLLTKDNLNGDRDFVSEIEMLSRLHHRNLVKLIGICTEGHTRCLVYEVVPNGSVESHLHGVDKRTRPLNWDARLKIAIDFGLAREATEGSLHISTRVMGTFGYVAPEYAMTGHLLVKSDVYSYGVVLLELLSGRKPVDMSRPPGEENLVTWARTLLTSKEGLLQLVDPTLAGTYEFDDMAKVAAIASMCIHLDVTHRPFMGEVVQALKLIYNDSDEAGGDVSTQRDSSAIGSDLKGDFVTSDSSWWNAGGLSPQLTYYGHATPFVTMEYSSGSLDQIENRLFSTSSFNGDRFSSPVRHGNRSGPLRTVRSKPSLKRSKSERGLRNSKLVWHGNLKASLQ
ncbi:Protein kinase domain-containing protein [Heracleum sosnowskyi]|uniref:Protein kinase domain-containing protein n=1 Tax=Heracleum sosnowskyi TaxID=360622 RepID=A0AAD8J644_9APIA|nr:Protein kinase domain-containing protein [Heracleum sosnowskyi]